MAITNEALFPQFVRMYTPLVFGMFKVPKPVRRLKNMTCSMSIVQTSPAVIARTTTVVCGWCEGQSDHSHRIRRETKNNNTKRYTTEVNRLQNWPRIVSQLALSRKLYSRVLRLRFIEALKNFFCCWIELTPPFILSDHHPCPKPDCVYWDVTTSAWTKKNRPSSVNSCIR